jgi:hypothetical protein
VRRANGDFNLTKYSQSRSDSHQVYGLPLSDWRQVVVWAPSSRAAQFVMRRYRLAPHTANVIAMLAGLGASEER